MRRHRIVQLAQVLTAIVGAGCSSSPTGSSTAPSASAAPTTTTSSPPPPVSGHPACVISADCPAGQYCDLEQCVQACNSSDPCASDQTCSPRARCIPAGTSDHDPTPTGKSQGSLAVSPGSVLLTGQDTKFVVTLKSSGSQPVRYRLAVDGPHLSVAHQTGQFTGTTSIAVGVDTSKVKGQNVTGDVKIYTTLGDAVVNAPVHVGVTGSYKGKMHYDSGPVSLGDAQVSLDIVETSGSVQARINSQDSLLFPATAAGDTTGLGSYTASSGVDVTVVQVVDPQFGGTLNPFGRSVGRSLRFRVQSSTLSGLEGTFDETIVGLFAEPITTSGHVSLDYMPQSGTPSFTIGAVPPMPASPSANATADIGQVLGFTGWNCAWAVPASWETSYAGPLQDSFNSQTSSDPTQPFFENIASSCAEALKVTSLTAWSGDPLAKPCGFPAAVACLQQYDALKLSPSDPAGGPLVGRLTEEVLQAPLLVAKNEIVGALRDSFTGGLTQEMAHYDTAMKALAPYATWVAQPAIIEFLRSMPAVAAQGSPTTSTQTQVQPYPSVRALSDLFYTLATVRGEQARIDAASSSTAQTGHTVAQQQAVLTYLEAAAVQEILKEWGTAPAAVSAQFTGVLTPLDQGFSSLLEGGNVFGVPDGFVPFVYRPSDVSKGATNFEQMLAIAGNATANESAVETQFLADARAYDTEVSQLQQELQNVKLQYDERISADCGTDFDPSSVTGSDDPGWSNCGGINNEGAVGQAVVAIEQASAQLTSAQSRISGQQTKIVIDVGALAQTQKIAQDSIQFISNTGQQIGAIDFVSGMIDALNQSVAVASNASVDNFGAPLAEAGMVLALGTAKAFLTQQRDQLQTAQTMEMQQAQADMAYVTAMAAIQKEEIDLAQAGVDIQQQVITILQAQLQLRDKLDEAKQIWEDRQRQLAVIAQDPTHDPSYRLLRDSLSVQVLSARAAAQQQLYLATSALQYELNTSIANAVGPAMNATNATNLGELQSCLLTIFNNARVAYGSPQDYITTVSVRKMLGISGTRTDAVTGQSLSEGEQFRQLLLANQNLDGQGGVGIKFSTDLQAGNGLWASDICDDRVATLQAQIVGNFQGDNEAQVDLSLAGGAVLRQCGSDTLTTWSLGSTSDGKTDAVAVIQAGVNTFGEAPANTSLFGQAVARANWTLIIPGGQVAPANADLDITQIDDVVLRFDHQALPRQSSPVSVDLSCLGNVGQ